MKKLIDINKIKQLIPHRYPFLLVDAVESYTAFESITAVKNVTANEHFFEGHFPDKPVMPGVLILEAMAQTSGVLTMLSMEAEYSPENLFLFGGIDSARFKRVVEPGDTLMMNVEVLRHKNVAWKFKGQALVDGELACEAEFLTVRG